MAAPTATAAISNTTPTRNARLAIPRVPRRPVCVRPAPAAKSRATTRFGSSEMLGMQPPCDAPLPSCYLDRFDAISPARPGRGHVETRHGRWRGYRATATKLPIDFDRCKRYASVLSTLWGNGDEGTALAGRPESCPAVAG